MPNYPKFTRAFLAFVTPLLLAISFSCKKVIEEVPVYDYHEISIPGVDTIQSISFPDPLNGYAITDLGLFKTTNAGSSWQQTGTNSQGIVQFFNADFGVLKNGRITTNGGMTWTVNGSYEHACITPEGRVIAIKAISLDIALMYITNPLDTVFELLDTLGYYGIKYDVNRIESHLGHIIIIPEDISSSNPIAGYNYTTGEEFHFIPDWLAAEQPTDLHGDGSTFRLCGGQGYIGNSRLPDSYSGYYGYTYPDREYYNHTYEFLCIDGYGDFQVAVGPYTIATNKKMRSDDRTFKEVLSLDLSSLPHAFYLVDVVNESTVVTVANGAKIFYGNI